jgi:hypothetical protein
MIEAPEVEQALGAAETSAERILYFAGMLSTALGRLEGPVVVVGGSAIEVYTVGAYTSGDIDLVTSRKKAARILESWGFRTVGRTWHHAKWELVVDLVGNDYNGSPGRIREVETPHGPVRLAAVEDLIINRLAEAKHWQGRRQEAFEQAALLASELSGDLDNQYLDLRAKQEDVVDILADLRGLIARHG